MNTLSLAKVCVVGGGAAGMMASIRAGLLTDRVLLLEKNASLGRKLGITGKGRCNVTNTADKDEFLKMFGKDGVFLRNALSRFGSDELIRFFEELGVELKVERQGRVFPLSDSSRSIQDALGAEMKRVGVELGMSATVRHVKAISGHAFEITLEDGHRIKAGAVVLATGGSSYPQTGSTGDGYRIASEMGHSLVALSPGLVPLEIQESWGKELQGLTLKNVTLTFELSGKKVTSDVGEMLFTHFGISGPLVLDKSGVVARALEKGLIFSTIDLKPGLTSRQLEEKFQREWIGSGIVKNYLATLLPQRLVEVVLVLAKIPLDKKCHQVTVRERRCLMTLLKELPLTVIRTRPLVEAMVTQGGVCLKEIDPKTMASRKVRGLFLCGEVLNLAASSGGYNLQAAFSTGYAAGESASAYVK